MATVICTTCKTTVVRLEPHKDKKSGFVFRRGGLYHVVNCGVCCGTKDRVTGGENVTQILEVSQYLKRTR